MCMDHKMACQCGSHTASFNFRDEVMPVEVIERLYCPDCSAGITRDPARMLFDNGWIIKFDMDVARFMEYKLSCTGVTPEFLFDEGYCSWRGVYPTDHIDSVREREDLVKLSKSDPRKYLDEIKKWGTERMERLARAGWRKARSVQ